MHNLLITFFLGLIGLAAIVFGFLYKQDGAYPGMAWYDVLTRDLPIRITFWVVGVLLLIWAGYFQFHKSMM